MSKVAYVLLALFTGGLGIHDFYAGKTGMGIASVLFCWTGIPMVVGAVQGIMALCKQADSEGCIWI